MYLHSELQIRDPLVLAEFAVRYPFATLLTHAGTETLISHIPLLCESPPPRVRGHVARINPQASHIAEGCRLTMIFHGPHGYRRPDGTPSAPLLPTWNYVAVHGTGRARPLDDAGCLRLLGDLAARLEDGVERAWKLSEAPQLVEELFPHILAFEVDELLFESRIKLTRDVRLTDPSIARHALTGSDDAVEREVWRMLELASRR